MTTGNTAVSVVWKKTKAKENKKGKNMTNPHKNGVFNGHTKRAIAMREVMKLPKGTEFTASSIAHACHSCNVSPTAVGNYLRQYDGIYVRKLNKRISSTNCAHWWVRL